MRTSLLLMTLGCLPIVDGFEEHGQTIDSAAVSKCLPAEIFDHYSDTSRSPAGVVIEDVTKCTALTLDETINVF